MINEIWHSTNMSFATNNMLTQGAVELLESHGNEKQKDIIYRILFPVSGVVL